MKFVFLTANPFPSYSGGMENWLHHVIRILDIQDLADAVVVSPESDAEPFYDMSGFKRLTLIRTAQAGKSALSARLIAKLPRPLRMVFSNAESVSWVVRSFWALRKAAGPNDVIVVIHSVPGMLPAALLKLSRHPSRVVCSVRGRIGYDLEELGAHSMASIYKKIERFLLGFADVIHANGQDTADYLRDELGRQSVVVPNGVCFEQFAHPQPETKDNKALDDLTARRLSGTRIVATVATLRDIKGIRYMIEAASYLKGKCADSVRFAFIGKGNPAAYEAYARELGVADMMIFVGEQKNVSAFLQQVDVCVAISGGGGVSNAAIEMMAVGKPVVAWDNSTYDQLFVHGQTGYLVKDRDSQALAEGIECLLNDPDQAAKLAGNAQAVASGYDWATMVPKFVQVALQDGRKA